MNTTHHEILRAISFLSEAVAQMYSSGTIPKEEFIAKEFAGKIPHDVYNRIIEEIQLHSRRYAYKQACAVASCAGVLSQFMAEYAECEDIDLALDKVLPIKD